MITFKVDGLNESQVPGFGRAAGVRLIDVRTSHEMLTWRACS